MTKTVIYDKTESLAASISSDVITFGLLAFCIWFSHHMGGGWWMLVTTTLLFGWLACRLPGTMERATVLKSKKEALEWAQALPEDA